MHDLVIVPIADAFMQVGVAVARTLAAFGWLQHRHGRALLRFLATRWRSAPLFGALLGVVPGCGGASAVMPLYARGPVSFGTVVAALVATMGDASFVILALDLRTGLLIHGILLVAGIATGYATDLAGIAPRSRPAAVAGASVGAAEAFPPQRRAAALAVPASELVRTWAFWVLAAAATLVAVPVTAQVTSGEALARSLGGLDPYLALGVTGTACAVAVHLTGRRHRCAAATCTPGVPADGLAGVLRHAARETCMVTTWVAVAYVVTALVIDLGGVDPTALAGAGGLLGVAVGAAVGLIPGCAPQVLLTGLHATGAVPFPTLLANAASQDGDALFWMLFTDRRAAIVATAITTVPGLALGTVGVLAG